MQEVLHYSPLKAGPPIFPSRPASRWQAASPRSWSPGRHPPGRGGRLPDRRGRDLLRVAGAAARHLCRATCSPGSWSCRSGRAGVRIDRRGRQRRRPGDKAGLAAGLLNASQQVGSALGLAILSAVAITRTNSLVAGAPPRRCLRRRVPPSPALGSILMAVAALIAVRIGNTRPAPRS